MNDTLKSPEELANDKLAEEATQKQLDMIRAYKNTFTSDLGKKVFADIKQFWSNVDIVCSS